MASFNSQISFISGTSAEIKYFRKTAVYTLLTTNGKKKFFKS